MIKELLQIASILYSALLLTIIIEGCVAYGLKVTNKRDQLLILCINMITNPILNFILILINTYIPNGYTIGVYILELIVLLVEGIYFQSYLKEIKMNPYLFSLLLNGTSFLLGKIFIT